MFLAVFVGAYTVGVSTRLLIFFVFADFLCYHVYFLQNTRLPTEIPFISNCSTELFCVGSFLCKFRLKNWSFVFQDFLLKSFQKTRTQDAAKKSMRRGTVR